MKAFERTITFALIIFFIGPAFVYAQSTKQTKSDTSEVRKEAPAELKALFEEITQSITQKKSTDVELEIDGLVIDQTKTKSGREFYDLFFRDWVPPQESRNYSIFIVEKPFRLNQTFIEVSINETLVYQSFLQPRYDVIETMAIESINSTRFYLAQYEELLKQLEGEDQSGSGIF